MGVQSVRCLVVSLVSLFLVDVMAKSETCFGSINIGTHRGVMIDGANKSHVRVSLSNKLGGPYPYPALRMGFSFKTRSPDGVLFYARSKKPQEYIALILRKGDLIYLVRCPQLRSEAKLRTRRNNFNDGQWHYVFYHLDYKAYPTKGSFAVDTDYDIPTDNLVSCGRLAEVVIGGTSEIDCGHIADLEMLPGHFEGCFRFMSTETPRSFPAKYYGATVCNY